MSLKDQKPDFEMNPKFRLINPAKNHIRNISRDIFAEDKQVTQTCNLQETMEVCVKYEVQIPYESLQKKSL